jgi:hypothetical protein
MPKTVVALYDRAEDADLAVRDARARGVPHDAISVLGHGDEAGRAGRFAREGYGADGGMGSMGGTGGAGAGAAGPGAAGGLDQPAGTGRMAVGTGIGDPLGDHSGRDWLYDVPGTGPVHVHGPMRDRMADSDVTAALRALGLPEDDADAYAEGVRRGGVLLVARVADGDAAAAREALGRHRPVDLPTRIETWRTHGWTRYDRTAKPYDPGQADVERSPNVHAPAPEPSTAEPGSGIAAAADRMRAAEARRDGTDRPFRDDVREQSHPTSGQTGAAAGVTGGATTSTIGRTRGPKLPRKPVG